MGIQMEKTYEERTVKQNKALHLFFKMLANELNGKGAYMNVVLKPTAQIQWDEKMVKEHLFKPLLKAMYKKESTADMDTSEVTSVHERLMLLLTGRDDLQIDYIDFPSEETTDSYIQSYK
jgi:hypothetical protein